MHLDAVFANISVDRRCFCGYDAKVLETLLAQKGGPGPYPKGAGGAACNTA